MLAGLKYAVVFYSILPLLVFFLSGYDFRFLNDRSYMDRYYGLNEASIFVVITILTTAAVLIFAGKKGRRIDAIVVIKEVLELRKRSIFFKSLYYFVLILAIANFFYIDHSVYWHDREKLNILPEWMSFYIGPLISFVAFLAIANIASYIAAMVNMELKLPFLFSTIWYFILDGILLVTTIINSGNRWYLALIALLVFFLLIKSRKLLALLLFPVVIFFGGILSIYLVAVRVAQEPLTFIRDSINLEDFYTSMLLSLTQITEGMDFAALISLAEISLENPDPVYAISRIITLPFPPGLIDKAPTFNILVTILFHGYSDGYSINTTLPGIFIYSAGVWSMPLLWLFVLVVWYVEIKILRKLSAVTNVLLFCLMVAGYRFNFEYIVVHLIYFCFLIAFFEKKYTKYIAKYENRRQ